MADLKISDLILVCHFILKFIYGKFSKMFHTNYAFSFFVHVI